MSTITSSIFGRVLGTYLLSLVLALVTWPVSFYLVGWLGVSLPWVFVVALPFVAVVALAAWVGVDETRHLMPAPPLFLILEAKLFLLLARGFELMMMGAYLYAEYADRKWVHLFALSLPGVVAAEWAFWRGLNRVFQPAGGLPVRLPRIHIPFGY